MASEIKVDTISEKTSANGVAIDSVTLKDGGATLTAPLILADGSASAPTITNTGDTNCGLLFSAADTMAFSAGGTSQFTMADGVIAPVTDNDVDLGTSSLEFKDGYFDGTLYCDTLNLAGTNHTSISSPITALNNATANELVTVGATTTELEAESLLTFDAASDPPLLYCEGIVELRHSGDASRMLRFDANRGTGGDSLGSVEWQWNNTTVAKIEAIAGADTTNKDDSSVYIHTRTSGSALTNSVRFQHNQTNCFSNNDSFATTYLMDINGTGTIMRLNRADDGAMVVFQSAGSTEGNVSISGSTCTYTTFTGAHWSQLSDNSKPTILQGTVMETINEMCDWYVVEFLNKEGKTVKEQHLLQAGQSAGDVINHTYEDETVEATIVKEENNNLAKVKISDSEDSKAVYGVFQTWDEDNDMNVVGLGTFVIRVHSGETVAIGDLLSSKGDGTAKVQADDIMRARTIAKVTSTIKQTTYADDSYTVPCTLHCG